ncbi:IS1 family transposase [Aquifex aeolicus]|uniref:IS1 family transposase n=1 Tax=Aquifex aeolicus (strain VF5) TaxID=224324 RepID=O67144_AQUAE|nr:IS1 family transposase [Aquifex aeolicus]AAC07115.1 putative protein [Aquifex aeolicus VF5]
MRCPEYGSEKVVKTEDNMENKPTDEMWSYVGTKGNEVWIWSVVVELKDGTIKKFLFAGDRSLRTFLKILAKMPEAEEYETDAYRVYEWLPRDRHIVRKYGRVNRNEALHSKLRDKLVAFKRKTKAFFRSFLYLRYALALFSIHHLFR